EDQTSCPQLLSLVQVQISRPLLVMLSATAGVVREMFCYLALRYSRTSILLLLMRCREAYFLEAGYIPSMVSTNSSPRLRHSAASNSLRMAVTSRSVCLPR